MSIFFVFGAYFCLLFIPLAIRAPVYVSLPSVQVFLVDVPECHQIFLMLASQVPTDVSQ